MFRILKYLIVLGNISLLSYLLFGFFDEVIYEDFDIILLFISLIVLMCANLYFALSYSEIFKKEDSIFYLWYSVKKKKLKRELDD